MAYLSSKAKQISGMQRQSRESAIPKEGPLGAYQELYKNRPTGIAGGRPILYQQEKAFGTGAPRLGRSGPPSGSPGILDGMAQQRQRQQALAGILNQNAAGPTDLADLGNSYFDSRAGLTPGYGRNTQPVDARYALGGQPAMPAPVFGSGVGPGPVADPQGLQGFLRRNAPEAFSSVMQGGERAESGVYNMPNAKVGPTGNVSTGPGETMFYDAGRGVARIVGKERTGYDGNGDRAILPRNETQQRMHEEGIQDGANRRLARLQSILQSGGGSMEGIDPIGANGQFTSGQLMRQLQRGPNQRGPVNQMLARAGGSREAPESNWDREMRTVAQIDPNDAEGQELARVNLIDAAIRDTGGDLTALQEKLRQNGMGRDDLRSAIDMVEQALQSPQSDAERQRLVETLEMLRQSESKWGQMRRQDQLRSWSATAIPLG